MQLKQETNKLQKCNNLQLLYMNLNIRLFKVTKTSNSYSILNSWGQTFRQLIY